MDWIAVIFGWSGTFLVGQYEGCLKHIGWLSWLVATSIWVYYGWYHGITGLMVSSIGYFIFELLGFIRSIK